MVPPVERSLKYYKPISPRLDGAINQWRKLMPSNILRAGLLVDDEFIELKAIHNEITNSQNTEILPILAKSSKLVSSDNSLNSKIQHNRASNIVNNKLILAQLETNLLLFNNANINILVIKGCALITRYYADASERRIKDIDLVVKPHSLAQAMLLLIDNGWHANVRKTPFSDYVNPTYIHAISFIHDDYLFPIDLHTQVNHFPTGTKANDPYWKKAIEFQQGKAKYLALCNEDNLSQLIIHGLSQNYASPVRWAVDAYYIISTEMIVWEDVVENAKRSNTATIHFFALHYLATILRLDIPMIVLNELSTTPMSIPAQELWSYRLNPPESFIEVEKKHYYTIKEKYQRGENLTKILIEQIKTWTNTNNLAASIAIAIWMTIKRVINIKSF
jgi:hypothetical protein